MILKQVKSQQKEGGSQKCRLTLSEANKPPSNHNLTREFAFSLQDGKCLCEAVPDLRSMPCSQFTRHSKDATTCKQVFCPGSVL